MFTGINKTNIHCIALMVKEREMIFYTFDFLSAGKYNTKNTINKKVYGPFESITFTYTKKAK